MLLRVRTCVRACLRACAFLYPSFPSPTCCLFSTAALLQHPLQPEGLNLVIYYAAVLTDYSGVCLPVDLEGPPLLRASWIIKRHHIIAEKVGGAKLLILVLKRKPHHGAQAKMALTMPNFQIHFFNEPNSQCNESAPSTSHLRGVFKMAPLNLQYINCGDTSKP